eukprot:Skav206258  [mRNA]  locus=scaffold1425:410685:411086:+ [translate_table: standard]
MCPAKTWIRSGKEYDFEDAQIVDSNLTEEEIRVFQRKRGQAKVVPKASDENVGEDEGKMKFQSKRKVDAGKKTEEESEKDSQSASVKKQAVHLGPKHESAKKPDSAKKLDSNYGAGLSKKKQRLSFDEGDEDE